MTMPVVWASIPGPVAGSGAKLYRYRYQLADIFGDSQISPLIYHLTCAMAQNPTGWASPRESPRLKLDLPKMWLLAVISWAIALPNCLLTAF